MNRSRTLMMALVCGVALTAAATASASAAGWFTLVRAGNGCRTQNANVWSWYSALYNGDANSQQVWCPLEQAPGASNSYAPSAVTVQVDPGGWASLSTCALNELNSQTNGYFTQASSVTHDGVHNLDTINFSNLPSGNNAASAEVECLLPSGRTLFNYSERMYQYFDWFNN